MTWRIAAVIASLLVGACVVSPTPVPPGVIDPERVTTVPNAICEHGPCPPVIDLVGQAGAVSPGGALLWIASLDDDSEPFTAIVREDGSFSARVSGQGSDVLRLHAVVQDTWNEPTDIEASTARPVALPCVAAVPGRVLDLGPADETLVRRVELRNDCGVDVALGPPRLRVGGTVFAPTEAPMALLPAETAPVAVERAAAAGENVDVLLIDITSPEPDRLAITLVSRAPP